MLSDLIRELLRLMWFHAAIEKEAGLLLEGDLERLEVLYGDVKEK